MPTSPLAVEPFEDRTAPSRGGFGHVASSADQGFDPRTSGHPGPQPGQVRENHSGEGRDGPFVGFDTQRDAPTPLTPSAPRGPLAAERGFDPARFFARVAAARDAAEQVSPRPLVVARATAADAPPDPAGAAQRTEPGAAPAVEPSDRTTVTAGRPVTAAVVATPSGLTTTLSGAFFAPPNSRSEGTQNLLVTPSGSVAARGEPLPAALQALAASSSVALTATGNAGIDEATRPTPDTAPAPHEPAPAWDFTPLVVEVPGLVPLAGALGIDLIAVEGGVRDVFDRLAAIGDLPSDGTGATAWLTTAAVLAGGAGYAAVRGNRGRGAAELPLGWEVRR